MQNGGASSPTSGHRRTGVTGRRRRRRSERPREAVGSAGDWSGHGLDQGGERRLRRCWGDAHHGRRWRGTAGILAGGGCPQWRRLTTGPHGGGSASVCLRCRGAAEEAWLSTAKLPTASLSSGGWRPRWIDEDHRRVPGGRRVAAWSSAGAAVARSRRGAGRGARGALALPFIGAAAVAPRVHSTPAEGRRQLGQVGLGYRARMGSSGTSGLELSGPGRAYGLGPDRIG
jgi:hypothetical protein